MNKKILVTVVAAALLLCVAVGGTIAYLTATTDQVVNTFSPSSIGVTLTESENLDFKMVPGATIKKDPKASITAASEPAWLFVKIEKSTNFDNFMAYEIAEGWTTGDGTNIPTNVIYRKVATADIGTTYSILKGDTVNVLGTVTNEMMKALTSDVMGEDGAVTTKGTYPTLTFTAYASQLMKNNTTEFTAVEAWKNVPTTTTGN